MSLAAGISKQFVAYVLAESPYGNVQRFDSYTVRDGAGQGQRATAGRLRNAPADRASRNPERRQPSPTMAGLATPTGSHPQLQYTVPADLPWSAAALGGFGAVTIDEADTSVLSPAQAMALAGLRGRGRDAGGGRGPRLASGDGRVAAPACCLLQSRA